MCHSLTVDTYSISEVGRKTLAFDVERRHRERHATAGERRHRNAQRADWLGKSGEVEVLLEEDGGELVVGLLALPCILIEAIIHYLHSVCRSWIHLQNMRSPIHVGIGSPIDVAGGIIARGTLEEGQDAESGVAHNCSLTGVFIHGVEFACLRYCVKLSVAIEG